MAYSKTTWLDRAVQFANRYLKSGETSGGVTLTADPGTVTQAGTPLNAANLNKMEQGIADAHTTLSRTATFVVAASNSSVKGKAAADYICTGTGDQTTINSALTAASATGGKVVLLEGLFSISGAINIPSNVALEGQGNGTLLKIPNANNVTFRVIQNSDSTNGNTGLLVSKLKIDGNQANNTSGSPVGIYLTKVTYSTVENVTVINMRDSGIYLSSCNNNTVTGNTSQGNLSNGISFSSSNSNTVTGNMLQGNSAAGISLTSSSSNRVSGNMVQGNGADGISLFTGSNDNTVIGNTLLENSQTTNVANSNITVIGSSTNNIQSNTCRAGATVNKPVYGIRVTSGTGNLVTNNDLTTGGATGAFSDAGTGTITTAGNKLA